MRVIGVTGGIGAGKSEVLKYLKEAYGARLLILDDIARAMQMPGGKLYEAMCALAGPECLDEGGELIRRAFAAKMYADPELLLKVNALVHPAVKDEVRRLIGEDRAAGEPLCVIESALLIEDHYDEIYDELWYVWAPKEVRSSRLKASRGLSDEMIDRILEAQLSEEAFREAADLVIDNGGSFEETKRQIALRLGEPKGEF